MKQDSLCYNVLSGELPAELQLHTVSEVYSLLLRGLPMRQMQRIQQPLEAPKEVFRPRKVRTVMHHNDKRRYIGLQSRILRKMRNSTLLISLLM